MIAIKERQFDVLLCAHKIVINSTNKHQFYLVCVCVFVLILKIAICVYLHKIHRTVMPRQPNRIQVVTSFCFLPLLRFYVIFIVLIEFAISNEPEATSMRTHTHTHSHRGRNANTLNLLCNISICDLTLVLRLRFFLFPPSLFVRCQRRSCLF